LTWFVSFSGCQVKFCFFFDETPNKALQLTHNRAIGQIKPTIDPMKKPMSVPNPATHNRPSPLTSSAMPHTAKK